MVKNMPQISKLEDIDVGTLHFAAVMRDYGKGWRPSTNRGRAEREYQRHIAERDF